MIKSQDVISQLQRLIEKGRAGEQSYRSALASIVDGNEKVQFIYFWQEHAKMVCEMEDKVRWLGGLLDELPGKARWGGLLFNDQEARVLQRLTHIHPPAVTPSLPCLDDSPRLAPII